MFTSPWAVETTGGASASILLGQIILAVDASGHPEVVVSMPPAPPDEPAPRHHVRRHALEPEPVRPQSTGRNRMINGYLGDPNRDG